MKNHIVVDLTTCRLSYFEGNELVREYQVGIGKQSMPTPAGNYEVVRKLVFEKQEDPELDFGSRRVILSNEKTCLHGSWNGPVEGRVSCGCVRMYNKDIEELFSKIEVGMPVTMIEG